MVILNFEYFAKKCVFVIFIFWASVSIEGVPKNYQQILQSRSVEDLPVINWFYGHDPNQINAGEIHKKEIKVLPIDEADLNEKPEPIENFLDEMKEKEAKETDHKDANTMHLLTDLNKLMTETPTKLAKVFINNTWRIFDFGGLGTSRRTRNLEEVSTLLAPFYALTALLNRLVYGTLPGNQGNNVQAGSLFDLFIPLTYLTNALFGSAVVQQKLLQDLSDSGGVKKHDSSSNDNYVLVIDNRNKEKANRLLNGKTPKDVLLKVKHYLDKDELDPEELFYIVWKLYDLFSDFSENDDEINLKLIRFITQIGEDPRFEGLFKALKEKNDPEFEKMWKLFKKSQPKLNKKYLSILRNLPQGKIIQHPSQHCFTICPNDGKMKKNGHETDDELFTRDLDSIENYRICCIDDDNEARANRFLGNGPTDEVLPKIEKYCDKKDLDPEYEWYIILKTYKMLKNVDKDDKDKSKIIPLVTNIGKDPKFEKMFEIIKTRKDPSFQEISKLFKSDPKELEEIIKTLPKKEPEKTNDPKNEPSKDPPPSNKPIEEPPPNKSADDKTTKDDKEPKKEITNVKPADPEPARTQSSEKIEQPSSANPAKEAISMPDFNNLDPHKIISWFHDPALERNARMIKDKVHYYSTKGEISYSDLEEVENLIKDPSLDNDSRQDLITFVNKWYGTFVRNEHVKHKFDELVHIIRVNPEYNNFFETLNPGREPPRNDGELKALLKPPATPLLDPKEKKSFDINSMLQNVAQEKEKNARILKDKVQQYSSKSEISYEDLEEVEKLLKDPQLDVDSKYDLITFVHKWYGTFVRNEKMKNKFDEVVHLIKGNPEHNKFFETLHPIKKETRNTNELKAPGNSPVDQINKTPVASMDRVLKNAEIMLKSPSLNLQDRINLIKVIYSWRKYDNLDETMKNKIDTFIKTLGENPENHRIIETLKLSL